MTLQGGRGEKSRAGVRQGTSGMGGDIEPSTWEGGLSTILRGLSITMADATQLALLRANPLLPPTLQRLLLETSRGERAPTSLAHCLAVL